MKVYFKKWMYINLRILIGVIVMFGIFNFTLWIIESPMVIIPLVILSLVTPIYKDLLNDEKDNNDN